MRGTAPHGHITGVPGWETPQEQDYLFELARSVVSDGVIVEIGAEWGLSASIFGKAAHPQTRIVSIDLFPDSVLEAHRANLAEVGLQGRTEQIKGDSAIIAQTWTEDIDLLFIDGDHTYEGALADIVNWIPFVKLGGLVVFHDVMQETNPPGKAHYLHHEVTRAINTWLENTNDFIQQRSVDSIAVFKRVTKAPKSEPKEKPEEPPELEKTPKEEPDRKQGRKPPARRPKAAATKKDGKPTRRNI